MIVETVDRVVVISPGGQGTVYLRVAKGMVGMLGPMGEPGEQAILAPSDARVIGHALIEYADRK